MNYAEIKEYDIANGPGVRMTLFVSGCRHHCKNCFNEIAWDFNYGNVFDETVENALVEKTALLEDLHCLEESRLIQLISQEY